MASDSSFDIVCAVDLQEVKNAVNHALKEIGQRFDFKSSKSTITLKEAEITVGSDDDYKLKTVIDILQSKLIKRGISIKALSYGKIEVALGGMVRQVVTVQQGISSEKCKEIVKHIKKNKFKAQAQIQSDQVRVSSKSRDVLQEIISSLKESDFGIDIQFSNYR